MFIPASRASDFTIDCTAGLSGDRSGWSRIDNREGARSNESATPEPVLAGPVHSDSTPFCNGRERSVVGRHRDASLRLGCEQIRPHAPPLKKKSLDHEAVFVAQLISAADQTLYFRLIETVCRPPASRRRPQFQAPACLLHDMLPPDPDRLPNDFRQASRRVKILRSNSILRSCDCIRARRT